MATVTSADGTTIAYETTGSGEALILVDGAGSFREISSTRSLSKHLAPHFNVYAYDRRGRGESGDTLPYAVGREVEDLRALIDAAGGTACVAGFSSGAVLALHAAAGGLPIRKLVLMEPPLDLDDDEAAEPDLGAEVAALVAQGKRTEAVEHFHRSIGVPDEVIAAVKETPRWAAMAGIAHTFAYDTRVTSSMRAERLATITTPTLVLHSEATDDRIKAWARAAADLLPNGSVRALPGEWHSIEEPLLAKALVEFFRG